MSGEAAKALVGALAEIENVTKGNTVKTGAYSYTYADLGTVLAACRPHLSKHGLIAVQSVTGEPGSISVATWFLHESGDMLEFGPLTMRAGGTPQEVGSVITYARRYSLLAALGIATEDDDGHAAAQAKPEPPPKPARVTYTAEQKVLVDSMKALDNPVRRKDVMDRFVQRFGRPETVGEDRMDDAFAWVTLQCQEAG